MPHITPFFKSIFISLLLLTILIACAGIKDQKKVTNFNQSAKNYSSFLRWGEWESLFNMHKNNPKDEKNSTEIPPPSDDYLTHLESIKIKHIETLSSYMLEDMQTGETRLLIEYRFDDSAIIKKARHTISWWHDTELKAWFTSTPLPEAFDLPKHRTIKLSPERH